MMLHKINPEHILYLSIRTVPEEKSFRDLSKEKKEFWEEICSGDNKEESPAEAYDLLAGSMAEFGKILCISVGYVKLRDDKRNFRVTTFQGGEAKLLSDLSRFLDTHFYKAQHYLCAYKGKQFDFPFIARRMLIHNLSLPVKLNTFGVKPKEVPYLDILELWNFGDNRSFPGLRLLTHVLGISSPEDETSNSVRDIYYVDYDPGRIISNCEKEVISIARILLKIRQEESLQDKEIVIY